MRKLLNQFTRQRFEKGKAVSHAVTLAPCLANRAWSGRVLQIKFPVPLIRLNPPPYQEWSGFIPRARRVSEPIGNKCFPCPIDVTSLITSRAAEFSAEHSENFAASY